MDFPFKFKIALLLISPILTMLLLGRWKSRIRTLKIYWQLFQSKFFFLLNCFLKPLDAGDVQVLNSFMKIKSVLVGVKPVQLFSYTAFHERQHRPKLQFQMQNQKLQQNLVTGIGQKSIPFACHLELLRKYVIFLRNWEYREYSSLITLVSKHPILVMLPKRKKQIQLFLGNGIILSQ